MSASKEKALAEIFEGPSDDEEFLGFGAASVEATSEDSRDSLHSHASWKPIERFKSKFITDELAQIFMDTDCEEEFEGFGKEESPDHSGWMSPVESEEDDIGFYSDDDDDDDNDSTAQRRRGSGLCVAFRFPARRSSTHKKPVPKKSSEAAKSKLPPVSHQPAVGNRKRKGSQADAPVAAKNGKTGKRIKLASNHSEEEEEEEEKEEDALTEAEIQILTKRAKNIQENKAMLAKLFADLNSLPELSPKNTPTKKRKQATPKERKRVSEAHTERRNPSRKARPPEHFGLEQEPVVPIKQRRSAVEIDFKKLMEVDENLRESRQSKKHRKRDSMRMPEDITEDELNNVADRAKDKILDKENGSTCHQCRQKTLDTKTECRSPYCNGVKGQFCGPCLRNRYGEDVRTALLDPTWECPICRGVCNCSLCRKRDGRCATGALTRLAKYYGYDNVKEYLENLQKTLE